MGNRWVRWGALIATVVVVASAPLSLGAGRSYGQGAESFEPAAVGPTIAIGWGYNNNGTLGNGATSRVPAPSTLLLPHGLTTVVVGKEHSLALDRNGEVWAWGRNDRGQLGDGTTTNRLRPVRVHLPASTKIRAITADQDHSLAVTTGGAMLSWGGNGYGQLGTGTRTSSIVPAQVPLPTGVRAVAVGAGAHTSFAVTSSGTVLAWGRNNHGQLGDGSTVDRSRPVRVNLPARTEVTTVASGDDNTVALTTTGQVWVWGTAADTDDSSTVPRLVPRPIALPQEQKVVAIAAGATFDIALTGSGHVIEWGDTRLATGPGRTSRGAKIHPVNIPGTVTHISATGAHALASTSTAVYGWGANSAHQLGDNSTRDRALPIRMRLPTGIVVASVAAGGMTSLVLTGVGPTATLRLTPLTVTVASGRPVSYDVVGFDSVGHRIPSPPGVVLTITAGTCRALVCSATAPGRHVVTARIGSVVAVATVTVIGGGTTAPTPPSSPTTTRPTDPEPPVSTRHSTIRPTTPPSTTTTPPATNGATGPPGHLTPASTPTSRPSSTRTSTTQPPDATNLEPPFTSTTSNQASVMPGAAAPTAPAGRPNGPLAFTGLAFPVQIVVLGATGLVLLGCLILLVNYRARHRKLPQ